MSETLYIGSRFSGDEEKKKWFYNVIFHPSYATFEGYGFLNLFLHSSRTKIWFWSVCCQIRIYKEWSSICLKETKNYAR